MAFFANCPLTCLIRGKALGEPSEQQKCPLYESVEPTKTIRPMGQSMELLRMVDLSLEIRILYHFI